MRQECNRDKEDEINHFQFYLSVAPCFLQTVLFWILLPHPSCLRVLLFAPCLMQTPLLITLFLHPSPCRFS